MFQQFHLASDPNGVPLFKPSMLAVSSACTSCQVARVILWLKEGFSIGVEDQCS